MEKTGEEDQQNRSEERKNYEEGGEEERRERRRRKWNIWIVGYKEREKAKGSGMKQRGGGLS